MTVFLLIVIILLLTMTQTERSEAIAGFVTRPFSVILWTVATAYHLVPFIVYMMFEPAIQHRQQACITFLSLWALTLPAGWKAYFEYCRERFADEGREPSIPWGVVVLYHLAPIFVFLVFKPNTQDGVEAFIFF